VSSQCIVSSNTCSFNGNGAGDGAGIHAISTDNRIEGNNCTGADRGIDVDGTGNIIIKNTCSGNTVNWTIVASNAYDPIVATPSGAAVNGNTAAAALGSTDPNANFTY
jgi:parallel beta-helix repeat protein